ncbi:glucosamine-6-phosphate deaminase ['Osedax' symbiont bacterium Rs2_46_30_T18]|nr:glucosamine-6-phosphate deaminase ['Osedax' symbiont bacterium Rs2_46_30_T18]
MQVVIVNSAQEVATLGASHCLKLITAKPETVLGLATGSTPVALYGELIELQARKFLSFKQCSSFNLDEYIGLDPSHPQSYRHFMNFHLFDHIDIDKNNTYVPDGMSDPKRSAVDYEEQIVTSGGIDLQILGVGRNGHIGFNEPSSSLVSRTRIKTLTAGTIADNQRFFSEDEFQPSLAITMGIATILESRKILLLATGVSKAKAVRDLVEGPLSASCPASALQMHNNTVVIIDREAASELEHSEYYQQVKLETEQLANNND